MRCMIASLALASLISSEPPQHLPHALVSLLSFHHGMPALAGLLVIVLLVCFALFKLAQMRSA